MANQFKSATGNWYTRGLFYEWTTDKGTALYTLKDQDHKSFKSLKRLYFEVNDPTEYLFATTCLGGWEHWQLLQDCNWLRTLVRQWRKEYNLKLKAEHLAKIIQAAQGNGREALSAAKYLVERAWEKDTGQLKGRPSKEQIYDEARRMTDNYSARLEEDYKRVSPGASGLLQTGQMNLSYPYSSHTLNVAPAPPQGDPEPS